jgi:hypothetical protein
MPSHLPASRTSQQKGVRAQWRRPIKKEVKSGAQRSAASPSDCDCDENTMAESVI